MKTTVKFENKDNVFSKALKVKVNDYFKEKGRNKTGGKGIMFKAGILFLLFIVFYVTLVFIQPYWPISVLVCILLGVNLAAIGFNVMHDAGHDSFSENKRLNTLLSYSLNLLGGNIYFWKLKHNIAHHTYTNIDGEDHDIEIKFMRIHHDQKLEKYHRFQRFYFPLLYGISYLAWIFFQDYEKYFRGRMGRNSTKFSFPMREKVIFWMSKVIHLLLFILIPVFFVGWLPTLIGIVIVGAVCGMSLATVFQLAHVVDLTEFKTIDAAKVKEEWMVHQLQSTANFATQSKVLTWLLGGLNFQVEHHLFPKISHVHYPALNRLVKQTCEEFNVQYNEFDNLWGAFRSHVNVIYAMSK